MPGKKSRNSPRTLKRRIVSGAGCADNALIADKGAADHAPVISLFSWAIAADANIPSDTRTATENSARAIFPPCQAA
jgi:hypothetical protein